MPFGSDESHRDVAVEYDYDGSGGLWVAQVLVGELQAGDGFFTPEQGAQIVVRCIVGGAGEFYGNNPVTSNVKVNEKATIDGHEAWLVESHLTFDIAGLKTKVSCSISRSFPPATGSGIYYASDPRHHARSRATNRDALRDLKVDSYGPSWTYCPYPASKPSRSARWCAERIFGLDNDEPCRRGPPLRPHRIGRGEYNPGVVSRSGRRTRTLPVLGRQRLVGGSLAQSERASPRKVWLVAERRSRATGPPCRVDSHLGRVDSPRTTSRQPPHGEGYDSAYANYQELEKKKSPIGWWIAGTVLVIGIIVVQHKHPCCDRRRYWHHWRVDSTTPPRTRARRRELQPRASGRSPGRRKGPRRSGLLPHAGRALGSSAS